MVCIIPVKFPCPHPSIAMSPNNFAVRWGSSGGSGGRAWWVWPVVLAGGERWKNMEKDGDIPRVVYFNSGKIWKKMKKMENIRNMWKNMEKTWEEMGNMAIEVYFNGDLKYDLMGIRWKILGK